MDSIHISSTFASVEAEIRALGQELTRRVSTLNLLVSKDHHGPRYKASIVQFAHAINSLEAQYSHRFYEIATNIGKLTQDGWQENRDVVRLWQQMAQVVTNFSEHPTKKVAALIISNNNRLLSFSSNRIPNGINKKAKYYVEGIRKRFILCAERMALAKFYNLSVVRLRGADPEDRIRLLSDTVLKVGSHSQELRNSFVLTTVVPCRHCRPAIFASRPQGVLADIHTGKHFTRDQPFTVVEEEFKAHNVSIYPLHQLLAA